MKKTARGKSTLADRASKLLEKYVQGRTGKISATKLVKREFPGRPADVRRAMVKAMRLCGEINRIEKNPAKSLALKEFLSSTRGDR
jgi:hypothetical protein